MMDGILSLEKAALERLTEDRLASGSLGPEVDDMLSEAGIYCDTLNSEYFSIDNFTTSPIFTLQLPLHKQGTEPNPHNRSRAQCRQHNLPFSMTIKKMLNHFLPTPNLWLCTRRDPYLYSGGSILQL